MIRWLLLIDSFFFAGEEDAEIRPYFYGAILFGIAAIVFAKLCTK